MNHYDERDYAEEEANRNDILREQEAEALAESERIQRAETRRDGYVIGWCHV